MSAAPRPGFAARIYANFYANFAAARERRLLAAGAVAVVLAVSALLSPSLYALLATLPAQEARLAALRADHAALQTVLADAARLRALPETPALAPAELPAALQRSLAAAGIAARVEAGGARQATVAGRATFRQWLAWLAAAPRQARLRVVEAELAAAGDGTVAARIVVEALP